MLYALQLFVPFLMNFLLAWQMSTFLNQVLRLEIYHSFYFFKNQMKSKYEGKVNSNRYSGLILNFPLYPPPPWTLWVLLRSYSKAEHLGNSTALWPVSSWYYRCLWLCRPWKLLQFYCHPWKRDSVPRNQLPEVIPHSWSSEVFSPPSILKVKA